MKAGLVKEIVKQLQDISSWFEHQEKYKFYASSIFITYDSNDLKTQRDALDPHDSNSDRLDSDYDNMETYRSDEDAENSKALSMIDLKVRVRMIDFNHASKSSAIDRNYLNGLDRLIKVFENLDALHKDPMFLKTLFPQVETNTET